MVMPYVQGGSVLNIMRFAYPDVSAGRSAARWGLACMAGSSGGSGQPAASQQPELVNAALAPGRTSTSRRGCRVLVGGMR